MSWIWWYDCGENKVAAIFSGIKSKYILFSNSCGPLFPSSSFFSLQKKVARIKKWGSSSCYCGGKESRSSWGKKIAPNPSGKMWSGYIKEKANLSFTMDIFKFDLFSLVLIFAWVGCLSQKLTARIYFHPLSYFFPSRFSRKISSAAWDPRGSILLELHISPQNME